MISNEKINILIVAFGCLLFLGCDSSESNSKKETEQIHFGFSLELTGSYAEVGEISKNVVNMFSEKTNNAGGILIGDKKHPIHFDLVDNASTTDGATNAMEMLVNEEGVLMVVGPNISNLAIPAGELAENMQTLMITPWSTNPNTTKNRSWVFRSGYIDTYQGTVLAEFATNQLSATKAAVLYAEDNAFPKGLATSFKSAWEALHGAGSVVAYETFATGDQDLSQQLTQIANSGCDFLFLPQYAHEVPAIVNQAKQMGISVPILGSDAWEGGNLVEECGDDCNGYYFTKHFVASAATGDAKAFVDNYTAKYGTEPGDVAALTWDALLLMEQALKNCGNIMGNLTADRECVLNGMKAISGFKGISGTYDFTQGNDPVKCIPIVQIQDGELNFVKQVCP